MKHITGVVSTTGILFLVIVLFLVSACSEPCVAATAKTRVAIVHLKGIKPYQQLSQSIARTLGSKPQLKTFELSNQPNDKTTETNLKNFNADVVVCIGHKAHKFCDSLEDIGPVVSVYDTTLLANLNPFHTLQYLQPEAKRVVAVIDKNASGAYGASLTKVAKRFGLNLSIAQANPDSWRKLYAAGDAIVLDGGVLIFKADSDGTMAENAPVIAVFDGSVKAYKELQQDCIRQLPAIDKIIDISRAENDNLADELANSKDALILCIGANSYQRCKMIQPGRPGLIVIRTESMTGDINRWGDDSGVSMFIEPHEQIEALGLLAKKPLRMALPYNPENSEMLVLKTLLCRRNDITVVPLPAGDSGRASRVITKAFSDYDGIWVIPDKTISIAPIQKFLLEESLKQKKILVTMMHPYTKRGAMMSVSGVSKDNLALCRRIAELINERLNGSNTAGRIVSSPPSISLNMRTIEKLKFKVPDLLLNRAEDVYGK